MRITRRITCIFLATAFVLLLLAGCKDTSLPVDEVIAETSEHRVFRSGDDVYIEFLKDYESGDSDSGIVPAGIGFDDLEDLKKRILENDFTDSQKAEIRRGMMKDGELRPIFDIEKLYQPICPAEFSAPALSWPGTPRYTFCYLSNDESKPLNVYFMYYEKTYFEETYTKECVGFFNELGDEYVVTESSSTDVIEYLSDDTRYLFYTIEDNGRTIHVKETYLLVSKQNAVSETVPFTIEMYVVEGDICYTVTLDYVSQALAEHPTEEWLLSFGMEPYIPDNSETE